MALIGTMKYLTIGNQTYEIEGEQLSIASASTLGGIKVGSGLSIDSTTGVLSTSITETDPVFAASAAAGITATNISNWNGKTNTNISYDSSSRTLKKTVNGTTSNVVDFGTAAFKLYTTTVTSDGTSLPTSAAVASFVEGKGYITGYTETDPVFSASAAAGITSTDISNWNAKVSDDKTWNGVSWNISQQSNLTDTYLPQLAATNSTEARIVAATVTPAQYKIAKYNTGGYLHSTTPSANDNSTKVATTAYVDAAIPDVSGFSTTDEKVKATSLSTIGTSYLVMGSNSGNAETKKYSSKLAFDYDSSQVVLKIGDTTNNQEGKIYLYGSNVAGVCYLSTNATVSRAIALPDASGTIALTNDIPTIQITRW